MNIHTQAILPLASTISAGAPAQQSTTDPQDMQLSTAGAAEHEVPPAPSAHTLQPTSTPPHSGRSRDPSSATQGTPLPTQQVHSNSIGPAPRPQVLCRCIHSTGPTKLAPKNGGAWYFHLVFAGTLRQGDVHQS